MQQRCRFLTLISMSLLLFYMELRGIEGLQPPNCNHEDVKNFLTEQFNIVSIHITTTDSKDVKNYLKDHFNTLSSSITTGSSIELIFFRRKKHRTRNRQETLLTELKVFAILFTPGSFQDCELEISAFIEIFSLLLLENVNNVTSNNTGTGSDITECEELPQCYNGKLYRNTNGSYECECFEGWRGPLCGEDIDECNTTGDSECLHGGSCFNTNGSFSCECKYGWDGLRCDEDLDECLENPCNKSSTCLNTYGSYVCLCNNSFYQEPCEEENTIQSYLDNVEYWRNPENQKRQLETLNETIREIRKNLTMDKTRLQSSINKRVSAADPRLSAAVAGYVGASFISIVIGILLILDFTGLCMKSSNVHKS